MQREDAVDDRVDGLAVLEGVGHEPEVARGCGPVQPKVRDCPGGVSDSYRAIGKLRTVGRDVELGVCLGRTERDRHGELLAALVYAFVQTSKSVMVVAVCIAGYKALGRRGRCVQRPGVRTTDCCGLSREWDRDSTPGTVGRAAQQHREGVQAAAGVCCLMLCSSCGARR
jgi:hypothetical protein